MPTAEQVKRATAAVEKLRKMHHGEIVIDAVVPDYHARLPKPCVGGWGRRSLNVTPSGKVLPCHAAESIPGLEFWLGAMLKNVQSDDFVAILPDDIVEFDLEAQFERCRTIVASLYC